MPHVSARDLSRHTSEFLDQLEASGAPVIVYRRNRPIGVIFPIDADVVEDYILANAPSVVDSLREAEEEVSAGRLRSWSDVFGELEERDRLRARRAGRPTAASRRTPQDRRGARGAGRGS